MSHYLRIGVVPAYIALCLLLGGASGGGAWANMVLQLLAIPLIIWALLARRSAPVAPAAAQLIMLLVAALAVVLLQLLPLPPSVWTTLPGRWGIADGLRLLGEGLPWMPLSLAPHRTLSSVLWTLPAIAVLLGMLRLGNFKPGWLAWAIVSVTSVAVGLGALQVAGGVDSPLYLYEISNRGLATGFFANSNNMAELLVLNMPFLGALYLAARGKGQSLQKSSGLFVVLGGALSVLVVGIAVNGSLAGIGLAVPALGATALMIMFRRKALPLWACAVGGLLLVASAAAVLLVPSQNSLIAQETQRADESRMALFEKGLQVSGDYFPAGSGLGTFPEIYPTYEDPGQVTRWYLNHVHNDYIELVIELGVAGVLLILLFLLWWGRRVLVIWRADEPDHFARAATIASAVILAHSLVEFPLRTAAISGLLAMCCALMSEARSRARRSRERQQTGARHLSAD